MFRFVLQGRADPDILLAVDLSGPHAANFMGTATGEQLNSHHISERHSLVHSANNLTPHFGLLWQDR